MKFSVNDAIMKIRNTDPIVILGHIFAILVFILYFLSPDDPKESIPSPYASRFMWTPMIPIMIGASIATLTMAGFQNKLTPITRLTSINLVFLLIILSPQFAEPSPIAEDGWWFVQIADRYGEYGNDHTEGYLSRMLSLIILDTFSRIFPGSPPLVAAVCGIAVSCLWISLVANSVKDSEFVNTWGVPTFTFVCFLMVSWWSPLQYTAQMLSLLMAATVIHWSPRSDIGKLGSYAILALIPTCHLQTSLILGSILITESFMRVERSSLARKQAFVLGSSFIYWNFTVAKFSFIRQFPGELGEIVEFWHLLTPLVFAILVSKIVERKFGIRDGDIWGGKSGTTNLSIVIGCILMLPLMFFIDSRMGAARLVPRLLAYSIVPFCIWFMAGLSLLNKKIDVEFWDKKKAVTFFAVLSIISGSLSSFAHVNYSSRTLILPSETHKCWEMTEEAGIVGLMYEHSRETNIVLFSHSMLPMSDNENFQYFERLGDEIAIPQVFFLEQFPGSGTYFSAVLETADLDSDDFTRAGLPADLYSDFYLAGEVPGACRFWVDSNDTELLDPSLNWGRM